MTQIFVDEDIFLYPQMTQMDTDFYQQLKKNKNNVEELVRKLAKTQNL